MSAGQRQGRRGPSAGAALFWMILLVAAYFVPRGQIANADSHLALAYAMVEEHTVRIDDYLSIDGPKSPLFDKSIYCGPHTDVRTCHHYYADKAPGISMLAAAVYAVVRPVLSGGVIPTNRDGDRFLLRFLLTLLAITVPCAAFAVSYWRFLSALVGESRAMLVTVGYAFGSMALIFSAMVFSHALTAALLFWSFIALFRARDGGRHWRVVGAGVLAGYAVGCEYPAAIICLALGLYALWGRDGQVGGVHRALRYSGGVVIGLIPLAIYNSVAFGTPLALGYGHVADPYYAHGMAQGLYGVGWPTWEAVWGTTFSPYRGLFILSPWLLLAIPGLARMAASGLRREAWLCGAISVAYFFFQWGYYFWDGGMSTGPRHFLPALPFLALPVAFAACSPKLRAMAVVLIAYSMLALALVVPTEPLFGQKMLPLLQQTLPDLVHNHYQNNWGMLLGLRGPLSLIPLAILLLVLVRRIRRRLGGESRQIRAPLPIAESLQLGNQEITTPG